MGISKRKKAICLEILYTLTIMTLYVFSGVRLSSAGDIRIADGVSSTMEPGFFLIGIVPGAILRGLAILFPGIGWWTVVSIFFLGISFFIIIDTVVEIVDGRIAGIVVALFGFVFYKGLLVEDLCYTQNTAVAAIAGFALIMRWLVEVEEVCGSEGVVGLRGNLFGVFRCKTWMLTLGAFFVLLAGSTRWKALVMCLPFPVMVIGYRVLARIVENIRSAAVKNVAGLFVRELMLIVLMIGLVFGSAAIHKVYEKINPYYAEYIAANELRRDIYDYPDRYPDWDEASEEYQAHGITRSWHDMVFSAYTVDMNHFSSEDLRVMKELRKESITTFKESFSTLRGHKAMWFGIFIIAILCIAYNLSGSIAAVMNVSAILACVYTFAKLGRNGWRVMVGLIFMGVISFLFLSSKKFVCGKECDNADCKVMNATTGDRMKNCERSYRHFISIALVAVVTLLLVIKDISFVVPRRCITDESKARLLDYMDSNEDIAYLECDDTYYYVAHSIWSGKNRTYCDNVFSAVGPFELGRRSDLEKLGINDIVPDMLTRNNVYTVYNDTWHGYIWDYYGSDISVGVVDSFEGRDFIRYVAPKAASGNISGVGADDISMSLENDDSHSGYAMWNIECSLSGDTELLSGISELYMNVVNETTGDIFTYPLMIDDTGKVSGRCYYFDGQWSFGETKRFIMGTIGDEYVNLVDMSGVPVYEK